MAQRLQNFQMPQRRVIERKKIVAAIKRQPCEMLHVAAQMLREVMQRRARRANGGRPVFQPESVQRRDLEMIAHGEQRRLRRKGPIVITVQNLKRAAQQIPQRHRFTGINDLRRTQPFELREQRRIAFTLRRQEIARGQIHERQAESSSTRTDGGEEVVPFGDEHPFVEMRAGAEDLGDFAFDEFAGPGVFELIADGHLASGLEQLADVGMGRMMRQSAHGHAVARRERKVEKLRAGLRVLEKHLVEIAEPEQEQRVLGQFAFDAAILRHHGRELGFGGHRRGN